MLVRCGRLWRHGTSRLAACHAPRPRPRVGLHQRRSSVHVVLLLAIVHVVVQILAIVAATVALCRRQHQPRLVLMHPRHALAPAARVLADRHSLRSDRRPRRWRRPRSRIAVIIAIIAIIAIIVFTIITVITGSGHLCAVRWCSGSRATWLLHLLLCRAFCVLDDA